VQPEERNLGPQPLDELMSALEIGNHELVAACADPLTHKAVQRARKGRWLTKNTQRRVATAFNKLLEAKGEPAKTLEELFTYRG
tara:strand:+ start:130 stop:381 length:252 start_codon:yes stop_codon:yes gene_type:complete